MQRAYFARRVNIDTGITLAPHRAR